MQMKDRAVLREELRVPSLALKITFPAGLKREKKVIRGKEIRL